MTVPGVLLRAKPPGVTSHDVVAEVRRSLPRGTKVGHAGTLDPFATGLLLVLVGRATRAQRFLMDLPKTYRAVEGTAVAVLVRELLSDDRDGMRKVSLRATDGRVDVSSIAREFGGGGHPQAAGFATPLPYAELVEKLREHVRAQLEAG